VTLRISNALLEQICREAEQAYPAECCGILGGHPGSIKEVFRLLPVVNRRTDDPHRYLILPDDLRRLTLELSEAGLDVLGFYHSHPDHPAEPSRFDAEHAWPWYSYLIVGVDHGRAAEATSWQLAGDRSAMVPESLDVFTEV
jgi:proteasome lid subunit RPN8/RPN11